MFSDFIYAFHWALIIFILETVFVKAVYPTFLTHVKIRKTREEEHSLAHKASESMFKSLYALCFTTYCLSVLRTSDYWPIWAGGKNPEASLSELWTNYPI